MAKKKTKRTVKSKKITIRLSYRQYKIIERYCSSHELTHNKFIKQALKDFILNNYDLDDDKLISKNQLKLFDFDDDTLEMDEMPEDNKDEGENQMNLF